MGRSGTLRTFGRRLAIPALGVGLVIGLSACGSNGGGATSTTAAAPTTTVAASPYTMLSSYTSAKILISRGTPLYVISGKGFKKITSLKGLARGTALFVKK
ncbi:MAG: hypothetical protein JWM85_365 [Acidimicrobiaceae bacterium]|nr:hypothetical protein [Acidimicrobiaceae bacterium]